MHHVLTLISAPENPLIGNDLLGKAEVLLREAGLEPVDRRHLSDGQDAAEILFDGTPAPDFKDTLSARLSLPVDFAIQPAEGREKKLLIADMDSTIIEQECLDELASFAGLREEISAITERAMRGELDFEGALKERVAMLKGLPVATLQQTLDECLSLTPGALTLVETMNERGAMTALVSGGFTFFTHRIAQATGFQDNQGNVLCTNGDHLTGEVEEPILGREAKREALQTHCTFLGIDPSEAMAVGDGANDLAMLDLAGSGVAFRAKPAVAAAARFAINHGDLTALLYLQGISAKEFGR